MNRNVQKTIEIRQLQFTDKLVDVPAVLVVQVPRVQVVVETVEIPQLPFVEKIGEITESRTVQDTQASESVDTALVRQVTQAEMVDVVEIGAEFASPIFVTAPVVKGKLGHGESVLVGINKLSHDTAGGVHVGKDDLDDGMFGHAEASIQQPHSSSKQQPAKQHKTERKEREKKGQIEEKRDK